MNNITENELQYFARFGQFLDYCAALQASAEGVVDLPATYFSVATKTAWIAETLGDGGVYSSPLAVTVTLPNLEAWNITTTAASQTGGASCMSACM